MPDPYPDVAALLAHLNELFPALGTAVTDADEARRLFAALRRPVAQPTPVRAVTETVAARDHGGVVPLRHYSPATRADGAPVVLFLHGGGWVLGGFDSHDELCRRLANGIGATVTTVDYRLAPEHPFPAALEDAAAALRHVVATSPQGTRVVVAGDSAGGNLAAALCLLTRDEAGPEIAGQLLLYPMTDQACDSPSYRDNGQGFYITADHLRWFWSQYLRYETDGASRYVSLLRANLQGLPPAHVVTAGLDPLRDEGEAFARRLAEAGVDVTWRRYEGVFHGFVLFPEQLAAAREAHADICAAMLRLAGVTAHAEQ